MQNKISTKVPQVLISAFNKQGQTTLVSSYLLTFDSNSIFESTYLVTKQIVRTPDVDLDGMREKPWEEQDSKGSPILFGFTPDSGIRNHYRYKD